jgi:hypothetical protein
MRESRSGTQFLVMRSTVMSNAIETLTNAKNAAAAST